ncbi:hypothetical protein ACEXQE_01415 [Herbiconiux sp. P17]|uniref:hypothetical protein n=1 Tax=Herbiconiux wuyangfengii TaxID=3342794 RepID=UPI0035B9381E
MKTYHVTVTREEPYWVAVVDGLLGGATESRSLAALDGEVRDLIAGLTDVDDDSFLLEWNYERAFPTNVSQAMDQLNQLRKSLTKVREEYERVQLEAVSGIRSEGVSVRDAAVLLHLSHQRVSQLDGRKASA